jgi:hypothetical protein
MTVRMASATATQEEIEEVLTKHGNEVQKEPPADDKNETAPEEPKRDDFASDEEHQAAVDEWQQQQEEAAEAAAEEEELEKAAPPARKPSKFQKRVNKITASLNAKVAELEERLKAAEKGDKAKVETTEDKDPRPVKANFG